MVFFLVSITFLQLESTNALVQGLALLKCAGGMNNQAIVDDRRIKLLLPFLWWFDFLPMQRVIDPSIFERVKQWLVLLVNARM